MQGGCGSKESKKKKIRKVLETNILASQAGSCLLKMRQFVILKSNLYVSNASGIGE